MNGSLLTKVQTFRVLLFLIEEWSLFNPINRGSYIAVSMLRLTQEGYLPHLWPMAPPMAPLEASTFEPRPIAEAKKSPLEISEAEIAARLEDKLWPPLSNADSTKYKSDSGKGQSDSVKDQSNSPRDQSNSEKDQRDSAKDKSNSANDKSALEKDQNDLPKDQSNSTEDQSGSAKDLRNSAKDQSDSENGQSYSAKDTSDSAKDQSNSENNQLDPVYVLHDAVNDQGDRAIIMTSTQTNRTEPDKESKWSSRRKESSCLEQ